MPAFVRIALITVLALAAIVGSLLLVAWPWPAPEVDWRTPLNAALAKKDCDRVGEIIDAATEAGSLEAYDLFADREALGPCYNNWSLPLPPDLIVANGRQLREARSEPMTRNLIADYRADHFAALGFWMRQYALMIDFFCVQPYNTEIKVDYAALSEVVPDEAGWLSTLHRTRRTHCIGLINDLAAALAARSEPQAKKLARHIAIWPPAGGSAGAAVVLAELELAQDFISDPTARSNPELLSTARRTAWLSLREAAATGDASAINLLISLLHKGRFVEDVGTTGYCCMQPYFWVLRSRRLGMPALPVHAEIERELSAEERSRLVTEEESDWQRSKPVTAP